MSSVGVPSTLQKPARFCIWKSTIKRTPDAKEVSDDAYVLVLSITFVSAVDCESTRSVGAGT